MVRSSPNLLAACPEVTRGSELDEQSAAMDGVRTHQHRVAELFNGFYQSLASLMHGKPASMTNELLGQEIGSTYVCY
jgi:hypothetical protein